MGRCLPGARVGRWTSATEWTWRPRERLKFDTCVYQLSGHCAQGDPPERTLEIIASDLLRVRERPDDGKLACARRQRQQLRVVAQEHHALRRRVRREREVRRRADGFEGDGRVRLARERVEAASQELRGGGDGRRGVGVGCGGGGGGRGGAAVARARAGGSPSQHPPPPIPTCNVYVRVKLASSCDSVVRPILIASSSCAGRPLPQSTSVPAFSATAAAYVTLRE